MITISIFKAAAELTYDNKENASKEWSKTWGYGYWRDLWAYKEYTATRYGQKFQYRSGTAHFRHGSQSYQEYLINGESVSKTDFLKAYSDFYYWYDIVRPKIAKTA